MNDKPEMSDEERAKLKAELQEEIKGEDRSEFVTTPTGLPFTDDERLLELRHRWRYYHCWSEYLRLRLCDTETEKEFLERADTLNDEHYYVSEYMYSDWYVKENEEITKLLNKIIREGDEPVLSFLSLLAVVGVGITAFFIFGFLFG